MYKKLQSDIEDLINIMAVKLYVKTSTRNVTYKINNYFEFLIRYRNGCNNVIMTCYIR